MRRRGFVIVIRTLTLCWRRWREEPVLLHAFDYALACEYGAVPGNLGLGKVRQNTRPVCALGGRRRGGLGEQLAVVGSADRDASVGFLSGAPHGRRSKGLGAVIRNALDLHVSKEEQVAAHGGALRVGIGRCFFHRWIDWGEAAPVAKLLSPDLLPFFGQKPR